MMSARDRCIYADGREAVTALRDRFRDLDGDDNASLGLARPVYEVLALLEVMMMMTMMMTTTMMTMMMISMVTMPMMMMMMSSTKCSRC